MRMGEKSAALHCGDLSGLTTRGVVHARLHQKAATILSGLIMPPPCPFLLIPLAPSPLTCDPSLSLLALPILSMPGALVDPPLSVLGSSFNLPTGFAIPIDLTAPPSSAPPAPPPPALLPFVSVFLSFFFALPMPWSFAGRFRGLLILPVGGRRGFGRRCFCGRSSSSVKGALFVCASLERK